MNPSIKNFVIRHLVGAKANQIEEFDFSRHNELTLGRSGDSDVQFDPEIDTVVSREHGKIVKDGPLAFTLIDNNSRNGIFVNKVRVKGSTPIQPGDEVQLGSNGPVFLFDVDPRPAELMPATRFVEVVKPTSEFVPAEVAAASPEKSGIGKQTFERVITHERQKSQRTLVASVAGLIIVAGAAFFVFKDKIAPQITNVVKNDTTLVTNVTNVVKESFDPEAIAKANIDKVVLIEFSSKLVHAPSGDDIYHRYETYKGIDRPIPVYVEVDGQIEPLLDLKKNTPNGQPIALQGSGSGFVVSKEGYILTNRHVAASWHSYYSFPEDAFPGVLYRFQGGEMQIAGIITQEMGQNIRWIPAETKLFGKKPVSGKIIDGTNTYIDVTFAKNDQRTPAKVVRVSNKHDVAMIKIDLPSEMQAVTMKDADATIAPGQKVVTMGYPGISPSVVVATAGNDFANRTTQVVTVPDPTVTDGSVGKVIRGTTNTSKESGVVGYYSTFGDYYQLTVNATGAGNSGGPVFDKEGNVIGIFTASTSRADATRITFAVPIHYGLELMGNTKVIN